MYIITSALHLSYGSSSPPDQPEFQALSFVLREMPEGDH